MRNLPDKLIPSMIVLLVAVGAVLGQTQSAVDKSTPPDTTRVIPTKEPLPAKPDKPKPSELEQMLTEALLNNPDLRVAEAKLREAEAELNRARFQVLQKVSTLHHSLEAQKAAVQAAAASLEYSTKLAQTGRAPVQDVQRAQALLGQEKAKLATLEAELPGLLGRPPQSASPDKKDAETGGIRKETFFRLWDVAARFRRGHGLTANAACAACHEAAPQVLGHWIEMAPQCPGQPAQGAMADKIRKALDTPVTVDIQDKPLRDALKVFEEKAPGISFHTAIPGQFLAATKKVTLHLEQVPLGAAWQALEDSFPDGSYSFATGRSDDGMRLAVREYGILVTSRECLPRGATLLQDFWKGHTVKEKAKGSDAPESPSEKAAPPEDIEGVIKATDPQNGYVTISIGSDAGLGKGHTLEVYRLKPEPKYLGSIRILAVTPTEAVAKPARDSGAKLEVGDQVTSSVRRR